MQPAATIHHEDLNDQLRRVTLAGRLDMLGMEAIDLKFTSLTAATPLRVIVDLTDVSFLASIGLRSIISCARALDGKGGRMVLLIADHSGVKTTLDSSGISEVIPVFTEETEARAALS